jgi:hypothetical protein
MPPAVSNGVAPAEYPMAALNGTSAMPQPVLPTNGYGDALQQTSLVSAPIPLDGASQSITAGE